VPKVLIATPAFDGKVFSQYALSLPPTLFSLSKEGVHANVLIPTTGSLLVAERNRLVAFFMSTDCTHMMCIDADMGWPENAVLQLLKHDKEFVVGCYPARGFKDARFIFRGKMHDDGSLDGEGALAKALYVPAGFMLISRSAIEKMQNKFPELYFEPKVKVEENKNEKGFCLFDTEVYEGEFWGEDYVFCRRAREAGVEIWIDPNIELNHAGTIGSLAKMLKPLNKEQKDKVCG